MRLDVQLFLQADSEGTLHHLEILQILDFVQDLAFPDLDRGVGLRGALQIEDGLGGVVDDLHMARRLVECRPVGGGKEQNRLLAVPDFAVRERRLIVADQLDHVFAGDVVRRHDHDS